MCLWNINCTINVLSINSQIFGCHLFCFHSSFWSNWLINILHEFEFGECLFSWFAFYLSDTVPFVIIKCVNFNITYISMLSLMLFSLIINDIHEILGYIHFFMFADVKHFWKLFLLMIVIISKITRFDHPIWSYSYIPRNTTRCNFFKVSIFLTSYSMNSTNLFISSGYVNDFMFLIIHWFFNLTFMSLLD